MKFNANRARPGTLKNMNMNSYCPDIEPRDIYAAKEFCPFVKCAGMALLSLALLSSVRAAGGHKSPYAGQLVEHELVAEYSVQQITQTLAAAYSETGEDLGALMRSATAVKAYAVKYYTPYVDGQLVIASGLVSIPSPLSAAYPVVAYMHGTALNNEDVPSYPERSGEATLINSLFPSHGYVAVMPDYIGQGRGTNANVKHPYLYVATTATTVADMLKAVTELSALLPVQLNSNLVICGLSQGGQATMALQKYLETSPTAQPFNLIASAPCAGPYFLPMLWDFWQANNPSNVPPLLAHLYLSYKRIYGFSEGLGEVFIPPYDTTIESIDDGAHNSDEMCNMLPKTMQALMLSPFLARVNAKTHPFYAAMATDVTCDFAPATPTRLYHAPNDELVTYSLSVYARDRMNALGAANLELVPLDPQWGHVSGILPFTLSAKRWFDFMLARAPNDYDGDRKADLALYNADSGLWIVALSSFEYRAWQSSDALGAGATPVPGDYNGDELADMAVYNRLAGEWKVLLTSTGQILTTPFGGHEFTATPCDFDGDAKTDPVVYRAADGYWAGAASSRAYAPGYASLGMTGYQPVAADYDGDRLADPAVYNPTTGLWAISLSGSGYQPLVTGIFGGPGWLPACADYDGDGLADPAVYAPDTAYWQVLMSGSSDAQESYTYWGGPAGNINGIPVPADYDGDKKADLAVYHQDTGLWELFLSSRDYQKSSGGFGGADYQPAME